MIALTCMKGSKVALFGLGGSGLSTARALLAGGAEVVVWDDAPARQDVAREQGLEVVDLQHADWAEISTLVLAPGVPLTHPEPHWSVELARKANVEIIGDIELFCRERRLVCDNAPVVAITGTNGKSTTTALIGHLLASLGCDVQVGGNIGMPALELEPFEAGRYYVIECSSYQIDLAPSLDPSVGVHINLSPDHLDRHGSMENYAAVKERLVAGSRVSVVGVDDAMSAAIAGRQDLACMPVWRISANDPLHDGVYAQGSSLYESHGGEAGKIADLEGINTLRGVHNVQNAAAAFATLRALGFEAEKIVTGFSSFPGLHHRMEIVGTDGHVLYINDSKATNADAAARALASFERIYWIAGGRPKSGGISSLEEFFPRIAKAFLIGEAQKDFARTLKGKAPVDMCDTLDVAVQRAAEAAKQDEASEVAVVLSPACASFDQYPNFEIRGDAFRTAVNGLDGGKENR